MKARKLNKKLVGFTSLALLGISTLVLTLIGAVIAFPKFKGQVISEAATVEKIGVLYPIADTYVSKSSPTRNFGSGLNLYSGENSQYVSYLKFDISSLVNKNLTSVAFKVKVADTSSSNQELKIVNSSTWKEDQVTYENRPSLGAAVLTFKPTARDTWTTIDLTGFISALKSSVVQEASVGVTSSLGDSFVFYSKDSADKPVIEYKELVQVTPVPTGRTTSSPGFIPTNKPVPTHSMSTTRPTTNPGSSTGGTGGTGQVARAFGIWDPTDLKYASTGPQKYPTCTKAFHDSHYVIGPDGKKYPTWHPPVAVDSTTGVKCAFGHEHGRNPSQSTLWSMVQNYFYFDTNKNGLMDPNEQQVTGVPFGYANEQLDIYAASKGQTTMRHEDHVGHKIEWINGEADSGNEMGSGTTGGVVTPIRTNSEPKWRDSGAKCTYFTAMHQGVHSADAITNNLHATSFFAECKGPTAAYNVKVAVTNLLPFGASGEFSNLCDAIGDRTTPVVIGKNEMNQNYPGVRGDGFRNIIQRSCVEKYFLVPQGQFSMNAYEAWSATLRVTTASNKTIVTGLNVTLDVEDAIRYYDPNRPNNIGYYMDLCYEKLPNGNKARGVCHSTNNDTIKDIAWNDTRSDYRAIHRGMYFQHPRVFNAGGPEVWYSDPYGKNAQTTPFPGSIKQIISPVNADSLSLGNIDPRNTDRLHDDGERTVHAPN